MKDKFGYVPPQILTSLKGIFDQIKLQSYYLMDIKPAQKVLDVGCSTGYDVFDLADRVGPTGLACGVDHDEESIAQAIENSRSKYQGAWSQFKLANADYLPYPSRTFDAVRAERLFQHLSPIDQIHALKEMIWVTKVGGRIVVVDSDWGSLSIHTSYPNIEKKIKNFILASLPNPCSGRALLEKFKGFDNLGNIQLTTNVVATMDYDQLHNDTGFALIEESALNAGAITSDELFDWRVDLKNKQELGATYATLTVATVSATRIV